jgi:hypothetical protein
VVPRQRECPRNPPSPASSLPERTLPLAAMGRYSTRNREGWTVKHKELPMVTETFYFETPNFGDWSRGSHTTSREREVYQKDYVDPPGCEFLIGKLRQSGEEVALKFVVDLPLDRGSAHFEETCYSLSTCCKKISAWPAS